MCVSVSVCVFVSVCVCVCVCVCARAWMGTVGCREWKPSTVDVTSFILSTVALPSPPPWPRALMAAGPYCDGEQPPVHVPSGRACLGGARRLDAAACLGRA